jgi:hypothetical protein
MAPATVGQPVPTAAALGRELRQSLPTALVEALDRIGQQMDLEILDPLLCAVSVEQLARTFERVFPKFRDYHVSTVLIMWGFLEEDPQRFSALTIRSFQQSEDLVRGLGPHWIGQNASLSALQGLATIVRVAKAAAGLFDQGKSAQLRADESIAAPWANSIIAYAMAFSSVLASLTALADGRTTSYRLENVATLAHWSKSYAARAYHFTKAIGLLKTASALGPAGPSEEEDMVLATAGLDSYVEMLRQDDQP